MKKEKANHIGTILLTILLTLTMPLNVLASTTSSGAITIQEQWANNVYQNYQSLIQDSLKVSIPNSELDNIWNNYIDHAYSIWNLNENDLQSHYGHFRNYVGSQFEMEKNADNTYNYNMSEDARTFIQDSFNTYIQDNPLSYKVATIPSYTRLNTSQFSNYTVYKSVQEIIKNCNGYAIIQAPNQWDGSNGRYALMVTIPKETFEINFYGSLTGGVFTSVQMEHNWANVSQFYPSSSNGIKMYRFYPNQAPVEYPNSGGNYWPNYNLVYNLASIRNGTGQGNIMTSLPKDEEVFVFASINAYKNYNSGNPQSYYQMSNYTGSISPYGNNIPNTQGSYESIVNNIQSGWTAQEVLALVDRIMSQNGGSGSGGGGSSSDNPFGFLGRIGELLSQLVTGVGELLTGLVDGVVNVFLGAEDENGERHGGLFGTIRDLISQLSTIFSTDISQFVSDIFGWLPSEIITLWTAGIMIAILFGILRIIRG